MNPQTPQPNPISPDPAASATAEPSPLQASHNVPEAFQEMMNQAPATQPPEAGVLATPLLAGDGDVIEKAWVEKAEQIIDKNKYDPHAQEVAAEALNQDYLKQRFGLDVRKPQDKS